MMHTTIKNILILGGSGFIGRHLISLLARDHYRVTVTTRNPERHKSLSIIPNLELVKANCHDPNVLIELCETQDAVINLIGMANEKQLPSLLFRHAHVELAQKLINACHAQGVKRLLHLSTLNAHAQCGISDYLQSKGMAEDLLHANAGSDLSVTSFQPSVVFGPNDHFFTLLARSLKHSPYYAPIAYPQARLSPVSVNDVVNAIRTCLRNPSTGDQRYPLCGPNTYLLQELVEYTAKVIGCKRKIIPLNPFSSKSLTRLLNRLPGRHFSADNYQHQQSESSTIKNGLHELGITPTLLEARVPIYLTNRTQRAHYSYLRQQIGLY